MRVLYISYFYPPLGGPAVLRNLKTVKYLTREGIACDVLTPREVEYLYRDASLLTEDRAERVIRTASWDPMALLRKLRPASQAGASRIYLATPEKIKLWVRRMHPIDDKLGWVPPLVRAGKQALREHRYDLVYVSLGPFSSVLGAVKLARFGGLPLVLDLRDYWNLLSDYDLQATALHRKYSLAWERRAYREASLIVTATRGIGEDIAQAFGGELAEKTLTVYNGWDEEDFQGLEAQGSGHNFTIAYFGNIYAKRSLRHFYAALGRLRGEAALPPDTRVELVGNFTREPLQEIAESPVADLVGIVPQLEHRQALARMLAADILLLIVNSDSPRGTLTSKVFEYLRAGRPILALVPEHGEAAQLLREHGHRHICPMESEERIHQCLKELIAEGKGDYLQPRGLDRASQTAVLAHRLRALAGEA